MIRSRVTFAITLAAAMLKLMQSPSIIAVCGSGKGMTGKPSIKTWSGGSSNASIASRIARWLGCWRAAGAPVSVLELAHHGAGSATPGDRDAAAVYATVAYS